ncbi:IclR family transcriptional regulator [Stenoxybacter acetivorans]|uniref:IclR family transcriptional regulator n=1 Tax=Stenoxybacter acetivorans TaxID=422441 RepID=UPI000689434E|nr:IclR family transcriptional regulator [Stenoxybacter acetivorans]
MTDYINNDIARFNEGSGEKERQFVTALARGLEILRCFSPGERYLGVAELSRRSGIPKPSVSRLAGTLVTLGYLDYSPELSKYSLGIGVLSLGYAMLSNIGLRQMVRPMLQELAEYSQASVSIGMRDRLSMVYVETVRSTAPLGMRRGVGSRLPMGLTALGHAYLAGLPENERAFLMGQLSERAGSAWPQMQESIEQNLHHCAVHGFCVSIAQWEKDVSAVAVPFRDHDGTLMSFSCGGAAFLLTEDRLKSDIGPRLVNIVNSIGGQSR